jgi:hypothetical protein
VVEEDDDRPARRSTFPGYHDDHAGADRQPRTVASCTAMAILAYLASRARMPKEDPTAIDDEIVPPPRLDAGMQTDVMTQPPQPLRLPTRLLGGLTTTCVAAFALLTSLVASHWSPLLVAARTGTAIGSPRVVDVVTVVVCLALLVIRFWRAAMLVVVARVGELACAGAAGPASGSTVGAACPAGRRRVTHLRYRRFPRAAGRALPQRRRRGRGAWTHLGRRCRAAGHPAAQHADPAEPAGTPRSSGTPPDQGRASTVNRPGDATASSLSFAFLPLPLRLLLAQLTPP